MAAPLRLLTSRYRQYLEAPPTGPVLAVTVERWTGWTATATPTAMPTAPPTATPGAPGA
jgi:hypothetical protein